MNTGLSSRSLSQGAHQDNIFQVAALSSQVSLILAIGYIVKISTRPLNRKKKKKKEREGSNSNTTDRNEVTRNRIISRNMIYRLTRNNVYKMDERREQEIYDRKFAELQKYLPFLEVMIEKLQTVREDDRREIPLQKMQNLHRILSNKNYKMKIQTLQRCEKVLQKLHNKIKKCQVDLQ